MSKPCQNSLFRLKGTSLFTRSKRSIHRLRICYLGLAIGFPSAAFAGDGFRAGPIFDEFALTLDAGHRREALGPFFYDQRKDSEKTWAVPPLLSYDADPATETKEFDLLYPVLTCERFGTEYRWQLGQLLSFSGGQNPDDFPARRFTIFPFYFQQRSPDTNKNYTALFPLYGHIRDRLFRDEIFFVLFPIYGESRRRDVVTDNYLYPFFHLRHGEGLQGWQFWPLIGSEHKDVTTKTNGFGETEVISGHDKFSPFGRFISNKSPASAPTTRKNSAPTGRFTARSALPDAIQPPRSGRFSPGLTTGKKNITNGRAPGRSSLSPAAKAKPPRAYSLCSAVRTTTR